MGGQRGSLDTADSIIDYNLKIVVAFSLRTAWGVGKAEEHSYIGQNFMTREERFEDSKGWILLATQYFLQHRGV